MSHWCGCGAEVGGDTQPPFIAVHQYGALVVVVVAVVAVVAAVAVVVVGGVVVAAVTAMVVVPMDMA